MSSRLEGKIALVTGGSSGIGLATAQRFAREGAYVYITGRRQPELDEAVKTIGSRVTAVRADASILADLDKALRADQAGEGASGYRLRECRWRKFCSPWFHHGRAV
jgi:NAD(P)-dependent dehydrogenase (short-subunit alcohol dehydrogenase family)